MQDLDDITGTIIDASVRIHRDLGPGLLESVYEAILARVLERRGLHVERQKVLGFDTKVWCSRMDTVSICGSRAGSSWKSSPWSKLERRTPNSF
jgi:hypothetical protein